MSSVGRFHVLLLLFLFSLLFSYALQSGGINVRSVLLDLSLIKNPYSSALTGWNSTISSEYSRRLRYIATLNSWFSRLLKYLPCWATTVQVFLDMVPAESTYLKFEIIHEIVSFSLLLTVEYFSNLHTWYPQGQGLKFLSAISNSSMQRGQSRSSSESMFASLVLFQ